MANVLLEPLSRDECLTRLASVSLGRIGLSIDALPAVLPVHFVMHDGAILIRTAAGSKLDAATRDAVVALEVDGIDEEHSSSWSVLVQGVATGIVDPIERQRAYGAELQSWSLAESADHFVRIELTNVSGRRTIRRA
jgi:nitroimidazol reductase NimA-like FMN-containing flavoprotein (pyridoxamine 5'-phosphate oxidase superfamily)